MNDTSKISAFMESYPRRPRQVDGPLCLDFINNVPVACDDPSNYQELVRWGYSVDVLDEQGALRLLELGGRQPDEAAAVWRHTVAFSEALYRLFSTWIRDGHFPKKDLDVLNRQLSHAMGQSQLETGVDRLAWGWSARGYALDYPLWPVVKSAAGLLSSDDLARIGECASGTCQCLFLDTSKNRGRRFCGETCSNVTRVRRHRERQRAEASTK
jgi:predicted RNA-binding Zn ribbon-like protein